MLPRRRVKPATASDSSSDSDDESWVRLMAQWSVESDLSCPVPRLLIPRDVSDPYCSAWLSIIYPFVLSRPSPPPAAVSRLKASGVNISVPEYLAILKRLQLSLLTFTEVAEDPSGPAPVFATVTDPRAFVHRFLSLAVARGETRPLHRDDDEILTTMYVDAGGRRICGLKVTLVMLSFVDLFVASGTLSTVCVVGVFLGLPDWKAVNRFVDRLVTVLRTIVVPVECLPHCHRAANPHGMEYPVRLVDISDHAGAVHTYSLSPPASAWFPSKPPKPRAVKAGESPKPPPVPQLSRLSFELSPLCDRSYISMMSDGPRPVCSPVTRSVDVGVSSGGNMLNWAYGRHGLLHGLGCLLCILVCDMDLRGFCGAANWISHSFRLSASWWPRRYTSPVLYAAWKESKAAKTGRPPFKKAQAESPSPPHSPTLSVAKGFLRDGRSRAPSLPEIASAYTTLEFASCCPEPVPRGVSARLQPGVGFASPADVTFIICHVINDPLSSSIWQAGLQYLRLLLDPVADRASDYLEDGAVTRLGRSVWDDLIRLCSRMYPWRASDALVGLARADKRCVDVVGPLSRTSHDSRLIPLHVSSYLCFWHGTYLYNWVEPFDRAAGVHEEPFEHVFSYLFAVSGAMGISHAVQMQNARSIAQLAVLASLCGFPCFTLVARWKGRAHRPSHSSYV
jgi:hypothetical protein